MSKAKRASKWRSNGSAQRVDRRAMVQEQVELNKISSQPYVASCTGRPSLGRGRAPSPTVVPSEYCKNRFGMLHMLQ